MGGPNTLFYSRRIGLVGDVDDDDLRAVRIFGGARLVGRLGGWDIGFLDMQTAALDENPSENFGVLRLRRQVINPYSYLGGILTSRLGADGRYNVAYGLRLDLARRAATTISPCSGPRRSRTGRRTGPSTSTPPGVAVMYERRTTKGFGTTVRFARTGRDFDPGMGFMMMDDYTAFYTRTLYGWFPGKDSALSSHDAFLEARIYWDNATKDLLLAEIGPGWEFAAKSGFGGIDPAQAPRRQPDRALRAHRRRRRPGRPLRLSRADLHAPDAAGPPPQHDPHGRGRRLLRRLARLAGRRCRPGRASPTSRSAACSSTTWSGSRRAASRSSRRSASSGCWPRSASSSRRAPSSSTTAPTTRSAANVRFRYNPREGTDFYLVYNEGVNTDRLGKVPVPPLSSGRALYAKFNYTFNF